MTLYDFFFPISIALDVVALAAIILTPILGFVSLDRHGWRHSRFTIAYLGYACCSALAASFALHFLLDGGEIYMVFVFWLIPFAVAAALALLMTVAIGSNRTLWSLALATIMLGLAQVIADRAPGGIGGGVALTMLVLYAAYALLVPGVCAYQLIWRRGWDSNPAATFCSRCGNS